MQTYDSEVTFQIDQWRYRLVANAVGGGIVFASYPGDRLFTVSAPGEGVRLPNDKDVRSLVKAGRMKIIVPNPWPHRAGRSCLASGPRP